MQANKAPSLTVQIYLIPAYKKFFRCTKLPR